MKGLRFGITLISIFLIFYILQLGKDLIIPFVYALFLWYLINIVSYAFRQIRYREFQIPLWLCFIFSISTIAALLSFVVSIISNNIQTIASGSAVYREKFSDIVGRMFAMANIEEPENLATLLQDIDLNALMSEIVQGFTGIIDSAATLGLILIYLMFLFLEQKSFSPKLRMSINNDDREQEVLRIIRKIQSDVRLYLGIKTFTSGLTAVVGYIIMSWVGLDFASFWALLIFLLNFIPSIGSILATFFPSLLALMQFDVTAPFWIVCIGISVLQFCIGNLLEPRLMGNSLNLSPLVILLSLTFWGTIWGIPGAFLCVPITVIIMIVLSHFEKTQPIAIMLSRGGMITRS